MRTRISSRLALLLPLLGLVFVPEPAAAGAGAQALAAYLNVHIVQQAIIAFEAVAALMLFVYGFLLIVNASKDSAYTDATNSFVYALIGFAILAVSGSFVDAFYMDINPEALIPGINSITDFMVTVASGIFVLILTVTGLRMLSSSGDTGEFGQARNLIITNSIGLTLTLLAKAFVFAVAGNSPAILVDEMKGIALFLLTLVGTICVCAVVVAGAYLIISVDEGYKDRAKKTIVGTLFTLGVVLSSYTLIATFI